MPELAKAYEPQQVEDRLYAKWQDGGCFRANPKSAEAALLHRHAAAQRHGQAARSATCSTTPSRTSSPARRAWRARKCSGCPAPTTPDSPRRPRWRSTCAQTEKKTRHDFTRDEFVARVWKWKEEFGGIITQQLRKIGALLRLVARALHPGRRLRARRAGSFRAALQRGPHLSRHAHGQLVPRLAHRASPTRK